MDFFNILTLVGGLALFLYGMDIMGSNLKKLAGGKLETFLARLTSNRFKGFLLGFFVTAVIQSSSATTVMLVGFVNSGIMKLGQTISIIMGANIGTTVTSWLLSLSGISGDTFWVKIFKPSSFTPILAAIGIIMNMMCKSDKKRDVGTILLGFAILMFGMETMSGSMAGLKESPAFAQMLIMFSNPIMGILMGTLLTAIIQSSSASVGILQALSLTGAIPYSTAIPIILGQNIGTTITPILSAISGNKESKQVAISCLYIKMIGVVVVSVLFYVLHSVIGFAFMEQNVSIMSIAVIHTLFNVFSTVILMPFCSLIEKLALATVKSTQPMQNDILNTLDDRFLTVPSFALDKCNEIVKNMSEITKQSIIDSIHLLNNYNDEKFNEIAGIEDDVDRYEDKLSTYLVKLSGKPLSDSDSREVTELLHIIGDVERMSDHAVNIADVAKEIHEKQIEFSPAAKHDISIISEAVKDVVDLATTAFLNNDLETAKLVEPLEQVVDRLKRKIRANHIQRLKEGNCTVELGFVLSDLLTNYERISDHCSNVAVCLLEIAQGRLDTHEYLSHVKIDGENNFNEKYEQYKSKYSI